MKKAILEFISDLPTSSAAKIKRKVYDERKRLVSFNK